MEKRMGRKSNIIEKIEKVRKWSLNHEDVRLFDYTCALEDLQRKSSSQEEFLRLRQEYEQIRKEYKYIERRLKEGKLFLEEEQALKQSDVMSVFGVDNIANKYKISVAKAKNILKKYGTISNYKTAYKQFASKKGKNTFERVYIDIQLNENPGYEKLLKDLFGSFSIQLFDSDKLLQAIDELPAGRGQMIRKIYGLGGTKISTQRELATERGTYMSSVGSIRDTAFKALRNPKNLEKYIINPQKQFNLSMEEVAELFLDTDYIFYSDEGEVKDLRHLDLINGIKAKIVKKEIESSIGQIVGKFGQISSQGVDDLTQLETLGKADEIEQEILKNKSIKILKFSADAIEELEFQGVKTIEDLLKIPLKTIWKMKSQREIMQSIKQLGQIPQYKKQIEEKATKVGKVGIENLTFPEIRIYNLLRRSGVNTIGELLNLDLANLSQNKSIGIKSLKQIEDIIYYVKVNLINLREENISSMRRNSITRTRHNKSCENWNWKKRTGRRSSKKNSRKRKCKKRFERRINA